MFYRNKKRKTLITVLILALVMVGGYVLGLYIGNREVGNKLNKNGEEPGYQTMQAGRDGESEEDTDDRDGPPIVVTTKNTLLVFEKHYVGCDETRIDERKAMVHEVGLGIEDIKRKFPGWHIREFSSKTILLRMEIGGYCPDHFILRDRGGMVVIYTPSEDGDYDKLFEETQIPTSLLPADIRDELSRGLIMDSIEEIEHFMENFES